MIADCRNVPVRFHKALRVNLRVIFTSRSTSPSTVDSMMVLTRDKSLRIYLGVDPKTVVSDVDIFAASIEQIATLIRSMEESSKVHRQSRTR